MTALADVSAWGQLLALCGGDHARAAAIWEDGGHGTPPTGRAAAEDRSEAALMWEIARALRARGALVVHCDAGSKHQDRKAKAGRPPIGWPDLAVYLPEGRHLLLEVKTPAGRLSRPQRDLHERLASLGHAVSTVRSVDAALAALDP